MPACRSPQSINGSGTLRASKGAAIREGMALWQVLAPSTGPSTLRQMSSHLDLLGADHCVYHVEPAVDLAVWTLLSDRPLVGVFHYPDPSETAYFMQHHNVCIAQLTKCATGVVIDHQKSVMQTRHRLPR